MQTVSAKLFFATDVCQTIPVQVVDLDLHQVSHHFEQCTGRPAYGSATHEVKLLLASALRCWLECDELSESVGSSRDGTPKKSSQRERGMTGSKLYDRTGANLGHWLKGQRQRLATHLRILQLTHELHCTMPNAPIHIKYSLPTHAGQTATKQTAKGTSSKGGSKSAVCEDPKCLVMVWAAWKR